MQYAWSASQYLELMVETVFGIRYYAKDNTVSISPRLTDELKRSDIEIQDICLTEQVFLTVKIEQ